MWCTFQGAILEILFDSFSDVWPGIVGVYHEFPTISCITKIAYFGKNVINIVLAGPFLSFRQKRYQVESIWIPHHCRHCFRTADCLSLNCWRVFLVWEPDLFVLTREIKTGFVQGHKIFPALVLD
jgi:hypothetical protein